MNATNTTNREHTIPAHEADAAVEAEIAHLRADEYVRLAKRYERARTRRKRYLYSLRYYQKKGQELAALGVTMDNLDEMLFDSEEA